MGQWGVSTVMKARRVELFFLAHAGWHTATNLSMVSATNMHTADAETNSTYTGYRGQWGVSTVM